MKTRKVGRNAGTGRFMPVEKARRNKATAVVETVRIKPRKKNRRK